MTYINFKAIEEHLRTRVRSGRQANRSHRHFSTLLKNVKKRVKVTQYPLGKLVLFDSFKKITYCTKIFQHLLPKELELNK